MSDMATTMNTAGRLTTPVMVVPLAVVMESKGDIVSWGGSATL
jgi:hypothetical protein